MGLGGEGAGRGGAEWGRVIELSFNVSNNLGRAG